jgi:rare lipoprotein A
VTFVASLNRGLTPIFCAALIAGCGTTAKRSVYYQDDGPPDRAPADLAESADATPRVEALHPRANRPYTALGRSFTPMTSDAPFRQRGLASWYGKQFHGNRTASGEIYDMFAMTAAHPTLPIPSYARVTHLRSGKSVIVRINDRGPFKDDRVIDLSYGAATKLGIESAGTGEVEVERFTSAQIAAGEWRRGGRDAANAPSAPAQPGPAAPLASAAASAPTAAPTPARTPAPATAVAGAADRWSVQVGAFAQQANADAFAARVATVLEFSESELPTHARAARVERDDNLFRVLIGALPDRAAAQSLAQQLERLLGRPAVPFVR